jgi:hypothetical protein
MAKIVKRKKPSPTADDSDPRDICFMIMPFGGWFDEYYSRIYKPAIENAGLIAHRADDLYRPSTITSDIWEYTNRSKVILADLSERNPNVFYELGLAHALAKPAIMVTQSMDDVPFDLRSLRIILYDRNDPGWGDSLSEKITKSLIETVKAPSDAILPTFLSVKHGPKPAPISEHEKQFLEIKREIDLLKNEIFLSARAAVVPPRDVPSSSYRASLPRLLPPDIVRLAKAMDDDGLDKSEIMKRLLSRSNPGMSVRMIDDLVTSALKSRSVVSQGTQSPEKSTE